MIKIYTSPSCSSCRKVKEWFKTNQIPFVERNIFGQELTQKEIQELFQKSENGTEDIISLRSNIIKDSKKQVEEMTIKQLISFIQKNPSILKRPIIVDDRRIQVGYNEEEITTFIPRARLIAALGCSKKECPKFATCEHANDFSNANG